MDNMFTSGRKSQLLHKVSQGDVIQEKSDRKQFITLFRRYFSMTVFIGVSYHLYLLKCNMIFQ